MGANIFLLLLKFLDANYHQKTHTGQPNSVVTLNLIGIDAMEKNEAKQRLGIKEANFSISLTVLARRLSRLRVVRVRGQG